MEVPIKPYKKSTNDISLSDEKSDNKQPSESSILSSPSVRTKHKSDRKIIPDIRASDQKTIENTTNPIITSIDTISITNPEEVAPSPGISLVSDRIWSQTPVYEFKFTNKKAYREFMKVLDTAFEGIDTTGKIVTDPDECSIAIHYFPRVLQKFIPGNLILDLYLKGVFKAEAVKYSADVIGENTRSNTMFYNVVKQNPYICLYSHLSKDYEASHNGNFLECAKLWDAKCSEQVEVVQKYVYESNYPASTKDFHKTMIDIIDQAEEGIFLGETHGHKSAYDFVGKNLNYLKNKGFNTLFLEGIPYEAQSLLDDFFRSDADMSKEVRCIIEAVMN
jgi:hypothetical protein